MSDIKMNDVFNLPVYDHDGSVMCQGVIKHSQPHPELCMQAISYTGNDDKLAKHTVHAINNHDRLEQENAELREAIEFAMKIKDLWLPYHIVTNEHEGEAVPLHRMYNSFQKLLNK